MSKNMKVIMENWDKFLNEEKRSRDLETFFENRAIKKNQELMRPELLSELEITAGEFGIKTEFTKWATLYGISTTGFASAVTIASFYAGWEAVLVVFATALIPALLNPVVLAIGATIALRFKFIRKIVGWIFKKIIGKDTVEKIASSVSMIIDKMVESSNGELSKEDAMKIYGKLASYIVKNSEFRGKLKEFYGAFKEGSQEKIDLISAELDDLIKNIIKRDILGVSEEEEIEDSTPAEEPDTDEPEEDDLPFRIVPKVRKQAQQGDYK